MLTPRENLLTVLRHEQPEWIPITAHCDPYNQPKRDGMDPALAELLRDVRWHDESTINLSRYLGLDIADFYSAPLSCRQQTVAVTYEQDGLHTITRWHTPLGELRQVQRYSPDTGMSYTEEHMVKAIDDLPRLACVFDDQAFAIDPDGAAALRQRRALVGDDGIVMFAMTGTPLGQMVRMHSGVETISYLWADARAELHALFAVMEDCFLRQFRLAATLEGVDAVLGMDDTSTTAISPAMFEEFCLGYTDHVADVLHASGKYYFHHSCGLIHDILHLYRQTRMDAVHAFQIPPMGDVTIAEGKALLGPKIVLLPSFVQMCDRLDDRAAVAESIHAMFDDAAPGDNVIMGIAPDPEKTMEEMSFVVQEAKKQQRLYAPVTR